MKRKAPSQKLGNFNQSKKLPQLSAWKIHKNLAKYHRAKLRTALLSL